MAKAPRPGFVKTRLIPALGGDGAAALARAFLEDSAALARDVADAYVIASPDEARGALADLIGLPALPQGEGDLGARIVSAFAALFARGHAPVLLIGADTPTLPRTHLEAAIALLAEQPGRAVFGPTGDGGYWTVGLSVPRPALFEGIAWSTPQVLADTQRAAARAGIAVALAPPWHDIDEPADLELLARQLAEDEAAAPATRAALARLRPFR
ncbi:TIGR04282 family arsenosugar biosynthesis glycosyltransferase [Elioraea rosea]|uniref:TIGR04282 family arsenosugar biosynthesis glycosyltransferase n=1 Tax=Elioraea rosea TaxID=2492390 RepID=UPI0013158406|nr:TIGR04282 family arsenosugar biosynthesis glycosyltransferase [Elioraea rosea]